MKRAFCSSIFLFFCIAVVAGVVDAQSSDTPQVSDSKAAPDANTAQAIDVLHQSIQALGGSAALKNLANWTMQASLKSSQEASGDRQLTWKYSNGQHSYQSQSGTSSMKIVSGHGKPAMISNGIARRVSIKYSKAMVFTPLSIMPILFHSAQLPFCKKTYLGAAQVSTGISAIQLRLHCGSLIGLMDDQTWSFDPSSYMPLELDYTTPDATNSKTTIAYSIAFSDFRPVAGIQTPFQMQVSRNGQPIQTISVSSIDMSSQIESSEFDANVEGAR